MLRKDPFIIGEYYHIYNRGIDKRIIFRSASDFKRFIMLLHLSNSEDSFRIDNLLNQNQKTYDDIFSIKRKSPLVSIGAWCLMNNHFHILLRQEVDGGVTKFMKKLGTAYSMYFNIKYKRQGALFGGPFKSKLIGTDDNYMRQLFGYIHLNPLEINFPDWENKTSLDKRKMMDFLGLYKYSSYLDHICVNRVESSILSLDKFPNYFTNKQSFKNFVENYFIKA